MSNSIVVVYRSRTGFSQRYAEWIAEELKCDLKENINLTVSDLLNYQTIIYVGGLYAFGINGINLIRRNFAALQEKNLIVCAVGATLSTDDSLVKMWESNFTKEQRKKIKRFYLRGGFDYSKLGLGNKILTSMMRIKLKNVQDPTEEEQALLNAYTESSDFTDKTYIQPVIDYVQALTA